MKLKRTEFLISKQQSCHANSERGAGLRFFHAPPPGETRAKPFDWLVPQFLDWNLLS